MLRVYFILHWYTGSSKRVPSKLPPCKKMTKASKMIASVLSKKPGHKVHPPGYASGRLPGLLSPNRARDVTRLLFNFLFRWTRNRWSVKERKETLSPSFLLFTLAIPATKVQREKRCITSFYQNKELRSEQAILAGLGFFFNVSSVSY